MFYQNYIKIKYIILYVNNILNYENYNIKYIAKYIKNSIKLNSKV